MAKIDAWIWSEQAGEYNVGRPELQKEGLIFGL